jgi:NAD(P)-dependent dehydrogenase (short-subunit alcohol dehydrogenase family)
MSGRIVLVTGGNRGIGLGCAKAFLKGGDRVVVTYRSAPPAELDGENVLAIRCDITSPEDVEALFTQVEETWGPVEVLVANAGITQDSLLMRMSEDQWDAVLDTNLKAAWRFAKRASRGMMKARSGRMVFISSVVGYYGSPGQANYGASKAGLIGLARSITRELGGKGVTANIVAPGPVQTDMIEALGEEGAARLTDLVPLKRAATTEEVAAAVTFLASSEASYISGAILPVDGGMAMGN